ncbi:nicotinamide riboside transporter PnuC [Moheibacter sediminis]|uniref:Nicotinamide riboside transporter PnuC n=1 Tax=Moheibacter sediminis TaxID=1434700 RepID=A0A1W1YHL0_9FLAO|nr:nicotinamide riboside transporter PnuC [Moheibacter sediminis]SMC35624.1 nicotinamide mononucleotide transporter [Moheibacter sediminis]
MNEFINYLIEPYKTYEPWQIALESFAVILGIASVYFSMKRNIWVYPTGIISTAIFIYLLFNWGLYGDMLINVYYTIMSVYGWILWQKAVEADHVHVPVLRMNKKEYGIGSILFVFSILVVMTIYYYRPVIQNGFDLSHLKDVGFHYTNIDYIDALLTAIFLVGMWLMARRKIENWIFWIVGDFIAIGLFLEKGYGITAFQYLIFTILAINAYFLWKKQIQKEVSV